jgi:hypothetical protein
MIIDKVRLEARGYLLCGRDSRAPWQWLEDLLGANGTDELLHLTARCGDPLLARGYEELIRSRVAQLFGELPKALHWRTFVIHLVDMQI